MARLQRDVESEQTTSKPSLNPPRQVWIKRVQRKHLAISACPDVRRPQRMVTRSRLNMTSLTPTMPLMVFSHHDIRLQPL